MFLERDFKQFKGGPVIAPRDGVHVTLSEKGIIYLNQSAYRVLSRPPAVSLYYSRERDMIAIEPADPRRRESFPVKPTQNGYRILAGPFVGHFGIRTEQTIRFLCPDITDTGALLLDLRDTVNVTPRRNKRDGRSHRPWKDSRRIATIAGQTLIFPRRLTEYCDVYLMYLRSPETNYRATSPR